MRKKCIVRWKVKYSYADSGVRNFITHISVVCLQQSFRVSNSIELIFRISPLQSFATPFAMFSLDTEDMYYGLDPKLLLGYVSDAIYKHGISDF